MPNQNQVHPESLAKSQNMSPEYARLAEVGIAAEAVRRALTVNDAYLATAAVDGTRQNQQVNPVPTASVPQSREVADAFRQMITTEFPQGQPGIASASPETVAARDAVTAAYIEENIPTEV